MRFDEEYSDGIYHIAEVVDYVLGKGHDPGSGICYHNDKFEMHGFWRHDNDECTCNDEEYEHQAPCRWADGNDWYFHHFESGFKFSWYKRIGGTSKVVGSSRPRILPWYQIVVECMESVRDDLEPLYCCLSKCWH